MPVYRGGRQVGRATTTTWSPVLKKLIALATVAAPHYREGTALEIEVTVEAVRHRVPATVVKTPFFNPARKTAPDRVTGMAPAAKKDVGRTRPKPSCARTCRRISTAGSRRSTRCTPRSRAGYAAICCRSAATPTLADDLLQETFMQIHRSRRTYEPGRPVTPWIYAIARHVYLMKRRSAGRRIRFEERLVADARSSDVLARRAGDDRRRRRGAPRAARGPG